MQLVSYPVQIIICSDENNSVSCQNALLHCRVKRLRKSGNVIFIIMVNGLKQRNHILLQDILYLQIIREAIMLNLIF